MNRKLFMVLVGTSLLMTAQAEAQRPGNRSTDRVVAPQRSARLADCRAPSNGRAYLCEAPPTSTRVVYRYASRPPAVAVAPIWVTPNWRHARVRFHRAGPMRGEVGQRWLRDALGTQTLHRVREHGRDAGLRGPVTGHWRAGPRRASVLVLSMDGQEVARLVDYDHDGDVDSFRLRNFRRW